MKEDIITIKTTEIQGSQETTMNNCTATNWIT